MKTNIVLIGLMGAGKTTIGKELSTLICMPFVDADAEIEKQHGAIHSLFETGENYFRDIETQIVESISEQENIIISTGGGVVLRERNMEALKSKGIIFYLRRPIEDIILTVDADTRPLLKNGKDVLYSLQKEREPLYLKYSDHIIDSSDIKKAIFSIASIWSNKQS